MKRALLCALVGTSVMFFAGAADAQKPTKAKKVQLKAKMRKFNAEMKRAEKRTLDEDEAARRRRGKEKSAAKKAEKMEKRANKMGAKKDADRLERHRKVLMMAKERRAKRKSRAEKQRKLSAVRLAAAKGDNKAKVAQELKHHARRVARLQRVGEIAAEKQDDKAADRVLSLLKKENLRHEAKIARLTGGEGKKEGDK